MSFDASIYDILLAGPKVSRLQPFFAQRGYRVQAVPSGGAGLSAMQQQSFHLVALELDLEDVDSHDFLERAQQLSHTSAFMLLEDASKTHHIVSTLVHGVDVYVPVPPDETRLFEQVQRHCIAAAARGGGTGTRDDQLEAQLEKNREMLKSTGAKVRALKEENNSLEAALSLEREKVTTLSEQVERLHADVAAAERKAAEATEAAPAGTGKLTREELEDLKAKRDFLAFLESENDELKKERDRLLQKLRDVGAAEDDFDEPTGESVISESGVDGSDDGLLLSFDGPGTDPGDNAAGASKSDDMLLDLDAPSTPAGEMVQDSVDDLVEAAMQQLSGGGGPEAADADEDDDGTDVIPLELAVPKTPPPTPVEAPMGERPAPPEEPLEGTIAGAVGLADMPTGILDGLQLEIAAALDSDEAGAPPVGPAKNEFASGEEVSESRIDELLAGVSEEDDDSDLMSVPDDMLGDDKALPVRDFHDLISPAGKGPPKPRRKRAPAPTVEIARPPEASLRFDGNDLDIDPTGDTALSLRPDDVERTTAGKELAKVGQALSAIDASLVGIDEGLPERTKTAVSNPLQAEPPGWGDSLTPTRTVANEPRGFDESDLSFSVSDGAADDVFDEDNAFDEATINHDMLAEPDLGADDIAFDDATAARPMVPEALIKAALDKAKRDRGPDEATATRTNVVGVRAGPGVRRASGAPLDEDDLGFDIDLD